MKKLTAKKYAQLLFELTKGKSKKEVDEMVKKFAALLKRKSALSLAPEISRLFNELALNSENKAGLKIRTPKKLSKALLEKIERASKDLFKKDGFEKEVIITDGITSGVILECGYQIVNLTSDYFLKNLETKLKS